ncbi:hypothetical protein [Janthinobacterium psychrotolerans]|uniref:SEL1 protein n=1 Tax=Janthinobacterium psychrotolerans TaxID=1747903 RepID=A0A1A7BXG3_9BURK|nr:hypothetical protein [Janthinobacterium psychrotolerans]OBV38207.1 SEL1 protein [Janthinobacterium psychrotolerans]
MLITAPGADALDAAGQVDQAKVLMRSGEAGGPQARQLFEQAAGQGSGAAAYYLGLMFKNGIGGVQDSATALRWLELAGERQVAPAMFIAANMLAGRDAARARRWLDAACALEYPEALLQKAIALQEGTMAYAKDLKQSALYFRMAEHAMGHRQPEP